MSYTLLLRGRLVGETDFEHPGPGPAQRLGVFRPTTHGVEVLPEITGVLSATFDFKRAMERRGITTEDPSAEEICDAIEQTAEGQRVIDFGKSIAALELRDPRGRRLRVASIAVSDVRELRRLAATLGDPDEPPDPAEDDPEWLYLISASLRSPREWPSAALRPKGQPWTTTPWRH